MQINKIRCFVHILVKILTDLTNSQNQREKYHFSIDSHPDSGFMIEVSDVRTGRKENKNHENWRDWEKNGAVCQ